MEGSQRLDKDRVEPMISNQHEKGEQLTIFSIHGHYWGGLQSSRNSPQQDKICRVAYLTVPRTRIDSGISLRVRCRIGREVKLMLTVGTNGGRKRIAFGEGGISGLNAHISK